MGNEPSGAITYGTSDFLEWSRDLFGDGDRGSVGRIAEPVDGHQRLCRTGGGDGGVGFWLASRKPAIVVTVAKRVPFSQVFRRVWVYGLGLSAGTIGFGVIATFITLYFSQRGWAGAAITLTLYSLGFTVIRLVSGNAITRFGGLKVALVSFVAETLGLFLLWHADSVWMADFGAFLTGCGFSLIFPALGVEAVKQVEPQSQGSALGTYSAFLDFGLGITGPLAGLLMNLTGIRSIYLAAMLVVLAGLILMVRLIRTTSAHRQSV